MVAASIRASFDGSLPVTHTSVSVATIAHGLLTPSIVAISRSPNALAGTAVGVATGAGLPLADAEAEAEAETAGAFDPVVADPVAVPPCPHAATSSVEIASVIRNLLNRETPDGDMQAIFARCGDPEPLGPRAPSGSDAAPGR